jgi:hypothetical protein
MKKVLTILITGPYRSGTGGDRLLMEKNLRKMEDAALILFREGYIPVIGEWISTPLHRVDGIEKGENSQVPRNLYPVAARLILKCDAVLRLPGESKGADTDVCIARKNNINVFYSLDEILSL